jgi:hypothetical protein
VTRLMKIFILIGFLNASLCFAQVDKSIYQPYKNTADSIVSLYFGRDVFDKFIRLDSGQSEFLLLNIHWDNKSTFDKLLSFKPNVFEFHYSLNHPGLSGYPFNISFMLDSSRQLMTGFMPSGLINLSETKDFRIISEKQAIEICLNKKIKKPIKEFTTELGWHKEEGDYKNYQQTRDLRDIVTGKIVWRIESKFREVPTAYDEQPYSEIFIIDAVTGHHLTTESHYLDWD